MIKIKLITEDSTTIDSTTTSSGDGWN